MLARYDLQLCPQRTLQATCLNVGGQGKHGVQLCRGKKKCSNFCQHLYQSSPVQASRDLTPQPELEQSDAAVLVCFGLWGDGLGEDALISQSFSLKTYFHFPHPKSSPTAAIYLLNINFQQTIA